MIVRALLRRVSGLGSKLALSLMVLRLEYWASPYTFRFPTFVCPDLEATLRVQLPSL